MERLKQVWERHPRLVSWVGLAIGMLIVFFVASSGLALEPAQRLVMAGATVVLAGLCVWIIYWE